MRLEGVVELGDLQVKLVWFDSMGAKSSCILVKTPDVNILVDPGAAEMQLGYPLPPEEKERLLLEAHEAILRAAGEADVVIISHYHYDHHTLPRGFEELYRGKELWIKDPNRWINQSQWGRARLFLEQLAEVYGVEGERYTEPQQREFEDPLEKLPLAVQKDFGDYQRRREELLEAGRRWFRKVAEMWASKKWCREFESDDVKVRFADGKSLRFGRTHIRFTEPLFHGIEYERTGWVFATVIERGGVKVLHSSDLQGPLIEDYAEWIVKEKPDLLILDGPTTYLFGYMLNRINLNRSVENAVRIVRELEDSMIIYDHHLLRDALYRERISKVYEEAEKLGRRVLTAAELYGHKPLILEITEKQRGETG